MTLAIKIDQLSVQYDQQKVLNNIDLSLEAGEILGLLGPSGCGKTTLLNTIAGFIHQASGAIEIAESLVIDKQHQVKPEHRHVGMIFQDYALFPHLKVRDNIAFGLKGLSASEKNAKVEHLLTLLHLPLLADRYPHELSGGQQQRVAIARSLAFEPKLLLLDEPFSNIDAQLRHGLMVELRKLLKSLNMSAIFVTHNKDEVFVFADKMAIMGDGNILQYGRPADICAKPQSRTVAEFLQLGSVIDVNWDNENALQTRFGSFIPSNKIDDRQLAHLLLKPQNLTLTEDIEGANAIVTGINVNEHGFKLTLSSISDNDTQIHLFHSRELAIGSQVRVRIKNHSVVMF